MTRLCVAPVARAAEDPVTQPRICRVNPTLGQERQLAAKPTEVRKRVMVVGGGPAGMECALTLVERGHDVTLYEKSGALGGRTKLAAMIKSGGCEEVMHIFDYLTTMIAKSDVKVHLKTEVDEKLIRKEAPDVVVVANSSPYFVPDIPGMNRKNVFTIPMMSKLAQVPLKMFGPDTFGCDRANLFPGTQEGPHLGRWCGGRAVCRVHAQARQRHRAGCGKRMISAVLSPD